MNCHFNGHNYSIKHNMIKKLKLWDITEEQE